MTSTELQQAAATLAAAELSALQLLQQAAKDLNAKVDEALAGVTYSSALPLDAARLGAAMKMAVQWPAQEVDAKVALLKPLDPVATTTPTTQS